MNHLNIVIEDAFTKARADTLAKIKRQKETETITAQYGWSKKALVKMNQSALRALIRADPERAKQALAVKLGYLSAEELSDWIWENR